MRMTTATTGISIRIVRHENDDWTFDRVGTKMTCKLLSSFLFFVLCLFRTLFFFFLILKQEIDS